MVVTGEGAGMTATMGLCDRQAGLDASVAARRVRRGDASDYLGFLRRVLRAYSERVVEGDVDDLTQLITLRSDVDRLIAQTVTRLRRGPYGLTWTQIAAATGTTDGAGRNAAGMLAEMHQARPPDGCVSGVG